MLDLEIPKGRFLGVLGGMGPLAGAFFMERLIALTRAERDQDHLPAILWSDPRIPGRANGHAGLGPDPFPWMLNGVRHLVRAGAHAIVMPCNTAHLWHGRLAAAAPVPILHIVRAVVDDLRRQGIYRGKIGLMGTATTLRLGLYQEALEARGYQWLVPSDREIEQYCSASIALVASHRIEEAFRPAADCAAQLKRRGADAVVLGCTELPLAIPHRLRPGLEVPIADSVDALALAAIDWYRAHAAGASGPARLDG